MYKCTRLFLLLFVLAFSISEARADNFVITSGFAQSTRQVATGVVGRSTVSLAGEGFSLTGRGPSDAADYCSPCRAGQSVTLLARYGTGEQIFSGMVAINGMSYDYVGSLDPPAFPRIQLAANIIFSTNAFIVPNGETAAATLTAPFTATGTLFGFIRDPSVNSGRIQQIFSHTVSGQGVATLALTRSAFAHPINGGVLYDGQTLRYEFQSSAVSPAPVPEPATMLLLGTGLAGVAAKMRRRKARSSDEA